MAKKIIVKELKNPDRFHVISANLFRYISKNKKILYLLSGIFILAVLLSGGWYFYMSNCEKKAQEIYSSAYNSYQILDYNKDGQEYEKAVNLYEELIKKYPRTHAALLSYYNLGNIYFVLGKMDKSIDSYKQFLNKSLEDNVLTSLAYYGLGYCYEAKEEYADALKAFNNSMAQHTGKFYLVMNYQNIGRIYEKMNKPAKAEKYYKMALEQTNNSFTKNLIKMKIAMLADK